NFDSISRLIQHNFLIVLIYELFLPAQKKSGIGKVLSVNVYTQKDIWGLRQYMTLSGQDKKVLVL
ncbi:MAG: hypothetical protein PHG38_06065, partial [Bacteroidales bacterium]|nr:hypothetical protein [Bacteroidales bacterium]MDD4654042.1 hypothetical protein [Bacteroidales bacterium]